MRAGQDVRRVWMARILQDEHGRKTTGKVVKDEQGALKVAGMLRNEPGALFLQCSLFLFPFTSAILRARFFHH